MLTAVDDNIIVKVVYKQPSNIVLPDKYINKSDYVFADVVSIGPTFPFKEVVHGSKIIFPRNEGFRFVDNNITYYSLNQKHCMAILED